MSNLENLVRNKTSISPVISTSPTFERFFKIFDPRKTSVTSSTARNIMGGFKNLLSFTKSSEEAITKDPTKKLLREARSFFTATQKGLEIVNSGIVKEYGSLEKGQEVADNTNTSLSNFVKIVTKLKKTNEKILDTNIEVSGVEFKNYKENLNSLDDIIKELSENRKNNTKLNKEIVGLENTTGNKLEEMITTQKELDKSSSRVGLNSSQFLEKIGTNIKKISTLPVAEDIITGIGQGLGGPLFDLTKQMFGISSSIGLIQSIGSKLTGLARLPFQTRKMQESMEESTELGKVKHEEDQEFRENISDNLTEQSKFNKKSLGS